MVSRLNLFWGLAWTAVAEDLSPQSETANFDLWIGCVDTRAARKVIQDHVQGWRSHAAYWLDIGNSSDSGQFVLGQPWNGRNRRSAVRLRTAPEIFPLCFRKHNGNYVVPEFMWCSLVGAQKQKGLATNPHHIT
jgi:hypothetical protein